MTLPHFGVIYYIRGHSYSPICTTHGHNFHIFHFPSIKIGVVGTFGGIKRYLEGICFILIIEYVRAISYMRSFVHSLYRLTKLFVQT